MSESSIEAEVERVMSERKGKHVQCFVGRCSKTVRRLRRHIRKFHTWLCPLSCSACPAKFVGQNDLDNHRRNGCPHRKHLSYRVATPGSLIALHSSCHGYTINTPAYINTTNGQSHMLETFFEKVDFTDGSAVNIFIANELQLDEASRNAISRVVDRLYKYLQRNHPSEFSINELVKGGSVGKGTAVKDKADIDCVVFLNGVKTMEEHKRKLPDTKNRLESCLKRSPYKGQITFDGQTPFAVKFKFRLDLSREFNIDLLPTFTTDQSREQLYNEMIHCSTEDKGYYSAHFVSLQRDFVKDQPPIVKNLIRLVKYWRKTCIDVKSTGKTRLPSSYPLELITIDCWEKAGEPLRFDIRAGFKDVLQHLVDNCDIDVIWYKYYDKALAERGITGMSKSLPFVLDPANPTNNVCNASDAEGWKIVADVAKTTLQGQPLKDIIFNGNWQII